MRAGKLDLPETLITALRTGKLVVFAGAGVSMGAPANLPSFPGLCQLIATGTGQERLPSEPDDRFLGRLHQRQVDVHALAAKHLRSGTSATSLQLDLLRLYPTIDQARVVTTNFDLLFEQASESVFGSLPDVYVAPALPLGRDFTGIVHVHGSLQRPNQMVLTDADFGRAYLTEGWARRFLVQLFRHFTVLFVGYSHNDLVLNYLARALPESEAGSRYALTNEGTDQQHWALLGIVPITYPSKGSDHSALYEGIAKFGEWVRRGILDWKRQLQTLASKPPSADEDAISQLELVLSDAVTVRLFLEHARNPEWMHWLESRNYLNPLFAKEDLTDLDRAFAFWIGQHQAATNAHTCWLHIAKHGMKLHPEAWVIIGREIARKEPHDIETDVLVRWASVLLSTAPEQADAFVLHWVAERCSAAGALQTTLDIFEWLSNHRLSLKQGFVHAHQENPELPIRVDLPLRSDHHVLNELWSDLRAGLNSDIARQVLYIVSARLRARHSVFQIWRSAEKSWDVDNWGRSAIEAHDQDKYPEALDVLIDAGRECLEWILKHAPSEGKGWLERLIREEAPLLRRLAIHGLTVE